MRWVRDIAGAALPLARATARFAIHIALQTFLIGDRRIVQAYRGVQECMFRTRSNTRRFVQFCRRGTRQAASGVAALTIRRAGLTSPISVILRKGALGHTSLV